MRQRCSKLQISFHENFKDDVISNIKLRIVLIRMINQMKYKYFDFTIKTTVLPVALTLTKTIVVMR
jgi:hypothetical protein